MGVKIKQVKGFRTELWVDGENVASWGNTGLTRRETLIAQDMVAMGIKVGKKQKAKEILNVLLLGEAR